MCEVVYNYNKANKRFLSIKSKKYMVEYKKNISGRGGFTLIEVLLVIALIAILAGITIVAINPARQYGNAANSERQSHVNTILNAIHQYSVDNSGAIPATIPSATNCTTTAAAYAICPTGSSCTTGVDLSVLTASETYLISMPLNPGYSSATNTGYNVIQSANGRVTVCAPSTDLNADISAKR